MQPAGKPHEQNGQGKVPEKGIKNLSSGTKTYGGAKAWACMATAGTGFLFFAFLHDDVTAAGGSRVNSEVYRSICSDSTKCLKTPLHLAAGQ